MLYLLCSLQYTDFTVLAVNLSVHCPSTTLANQKSTTGLTISYLYSFWVQFKAFSQVLSLFNFLLKENHVLKIKHTLLTLCSDTHSKSLTHGRESVFTKIKPCGMDRRDGQWTRFIFCTLLTHVSPYGNCQTDDISADLPATFNLWL